ncbi:MAG: DUF3332 family protein [Leptospirales bacterium]
MRVRMLGTGLALLFSAVLLSGCYGQFALVRTLYKANGQVENKWARSGLTALMVILPVYEFAGLGDVIIFNPIEFWSKKNPITGTASVAMKDGKTLPQNGTTTGIAKNGAHVTVSWHYTKDRSRVSAVVVSRSEAGKISVQLVRSHTMDGVVATGNLQVTDVTFGGTIPSVHRTLG